MRVRRKERRSEGHITYINPANPVQPKTFSGVNYLAPHPAVGHLLTIPSIPLHNADSPAPPRRALMFFLCLSPTTDQQLPPSRVINESKLIDIVSGVIN